MTDKIELSSPDELLYMIETNDGTYFVFEADYLDSIDYVSKILKERTEHFSEFIEAKNPLKTIMRRHL